MNMQALIHFVSTLSCAPAGPFNWVGGWGPLRAFRARRSLFAAKPQTRFCAALGCDKTFFVQVGPGTCYLSVVYLVLAWMSTHFLFTLGSASLSLQQPQPRPEI